MSKPETENIEKPRENIDELSFLDEKPKQDLAKVEVAEETLPAQKKPTSLTTREFPWWLLVFFGGIVVGATTFYLTTIFDILKLPTTEKIIVNQSKVTPTPQAEQLLASDEAELVEKDQLKILIVNGTGISGQAAKIKAQLEGLGFKDFILDNIIRTDKSVTKLQYSINFPSTLKDEIKHELEKTFAKLEEEATSAGDFNLIVTTGEYLK